MTIVLICVAVKRELHSCTQNDTIFAEKLITDADTQGLKFKDLKKPSSLFSTTFTDHDNIPQLFMP